MVLNQAIKVKLLHSQAAIIKHPTVYETSMKQKVNYVYNIWGTTKYKKRVTTTLKLHFNSTKFYPFHCYATLVYGFSTFTSASLNQNAT